MAQSNSRRCFGGCGAELDPARFHFCLFAQECVEHRGPFCRDCFAAHWLAAHSRERESQEPVGASVDN